MQSGFRLAFIFVVLFCLGCSDQAKAPLVTNDIIDGWTPEERAARAPSPAFEAVYRRQQTEVASLLEENPDLFLSRNGEGRTPLMVALTRQDPDPRDQELALLIVSKMSVEDLSAPSDGGRSLISLAAERGYVEVIEKIGEKYKESLRFGLARFHNIDFLDDLNRNALFYAANSNVAKKLEEFWMQWTVSWANSATFWSGFYRRDISGQNFLHTAAAQNRYDLLQWAMGKLCADPFFVESEFLFGVPRLGGRVVDFFQGSLQRAPLIPDDMINQTDIGGDSPLHLAVRQGHVEASRALMSCRLQHYRVKNLLGRNPLSEMLASLDRNLNPIPQNFKTIFDALIRQQNYISFSRRFTSLMVNDQDIELEFSALHYAARLSDPYFYLQLEDKGDVLLESSITRETPRDLFLGRQRAVSQ